MSGNFGFSAFAHIDSSFAQSEPRAQPNNGNPRMCKNAATDGSLSPHIACIGHMRPQTEQDRIAVKIGRARLSGPSQVTKDATVAELDASGKITILAIGTNEWVCFPGNENEIGNVPMSCDRMGLQWLKDLLEGKPAPTNKAPGLIYMLCGATQRSVTNPYDKDSAAIPIGPHI